MFAIESVVVNKLRTLLSLLGITIGIFAIISVFTIIDSMERNLRDNVNAVGTNIIYLAKWPWVPEDNEYRWWKYMNRPEMTVAEFTEISEMVPSAEAVAISTGFSSVIKRGNQSLDRVYVIGATFDYDKMRKTELEHGRYFTPFESRSGANAAIIGSTVAEELFPDEDPVGKEIKIRDKKLNVIGVFAKEGDNMFGFSYDKQVLIPLKLAGNFINLRWAGLDMILRGREDVNFEDFKEEAVSMMRQVRRLSPMAESNFSVNEVSALNKQLDSIFSVLNLVGGIIGIFSILVGGFGVANIMFVSVRERTTQIGIQKALGARPFVILLQFVFEAIMLSIVGGGVGLLLIFAGTVIVSSTTDFTIVLTLKNIIIGLGISSLVGAISGIFPAYSAAMMQPVKAIYKT